VSYARFDDHYHDDPRLLAIDMGAGQLNTLATTWSAGQLRDGVIPEAVARLLARTEESYRAWSEVLVAVGLWRRVPKGFRIVDYLKTNPCAREVKQRIQAHRQRQQDYQQRRQADASSDASSARQHPVERRGVERRKNRDPKQLGTDPTDARASFALFWTAYPWHLARQDAEAAWRKLAPEAALVAAICAAIAWQRERGCLRPGVGRDGKPVRLYPATYVNGRRWEDEPEPVPAVPPVSPLMAAAIERVSTRTAAAAMGSTRSR
jgi:hypothetical protein